MAKKLKKNSNYQTDARKAAKQQENLRLQQEQARRKLPHKLNEGEKKQLRTKTVHIICILMVVVLVLTSGLAAVYSLTASGRQSTAADYAYPPLFVYNGTVYAVTSEAVYEKPEGETVEEITGTTTGDQNTFPLAEGSCNFGKRTVPFLRVDGVLYCSTKEGVYLKCAPFRQSETDSSDTSSNDTSN